MMLLKSNQTAFYLPIISSFQIKYWNQDFLKRFVSFPYFFLIRRKQKYSFSCWDLKAVKFTFIGCFSMNAAKKNIWEGDLVPVNYILLNISWVKVVEIIIKIQEAFNDTLWKLKVFKYVHNSKQNMC